MFLMSEVPLYTPDAQPLALTPTSARALLPPRERNLFIDNLLVRMHLIIEMIWWSGLASWEIETLPVVLYRPTPSLSPNH